MLVRGGVRLLLCAAVGVVAGLGASCEPRRPYERTVLVYPLEREVELLNTAAYPLGAYTVAPGDTARGIAGKLGVDYEVFAAFNGIDEKTVLRPGDVLVVPAVALRAGGVQAVQARVSGGAEGLVGADGKLRAESAGVVTAVFRKYTSLGDVVIIEGDEERIVYSGSFEPAVTRGERVAAGDVLATGADSTSAKARRFAK